MAAVFQARFTALARRERAEIGFLSGTVSAIAVSFAVIVYSSLHPAKAPYMKQVSVFSSVDKHSSNINLPYTKNGLPQETLDFTIPLTYKRGEITVFQLTPDDCLQSMDINGKAVPLAGEVFKHRCDWQHGFSIDLQPYLLTGDNDVHIRIINHLGPMGLKFEPVTN